MGPSPSNPTLTLLTPHPFSQIETCPHLAILQLTIPILTVTRLRARTLVYDVYDVYDPPPQYINNQSPNPKSHKLSSLNPCPSLQPKAPTETCDAAAKCVSFVEAPDPNPTNPSPTSHHIDPALYLNPTPKLGP